MGKMDSSVIGNTYAHTNKKTEVQSQAAHTVKIQTNVAMDGFSSQAEANWSYRIILSDCTNIKSLMSLGANIRNFRAYMLIVSDSERIFSIVLWIFEHFFEKSKNFWGNT